MEQEGKKLPRAGLNCRPAENFPLLISLRPNSGNATRDSLAYAVV